MGIKTRVYRYENQLAMNIPSQVLPEPTITEKEEIIERPGELVETVSTLPLIVITHAERTAVLLTYTPSLGERPFIREFLGFDPDQPIWIRASHTDEWVQAHKYHWLSPTRSYGRVWYPRYLAEQIGIERYPKIQTHDFFIRGTTPPRMERRIVAVRMRRVEIRHLGLIHGAVEYAPDRYRWVIPEETQPGLRPKEIFRDSPVDATCHLSLDNIIDVDLGIPPEFQHLIKQAITNNKISFRKMAVINIAKTEKLDYPFFCEIRSFIITEYPQSFYELRLPDGSERHQPLDEALENTNKNIFSWHPFMSKIHIGVYKGGLEQIPNEESPFEEEYGGRLPPIETIKLRYAMKQIRIRNKYTATHGFEDYYYDNERIEAETAGSKKLWLDGNGFMWLQEIRGVRLW